MLPSAIEIERRTWRRLHRGILKQIAKDTQYHISMVSMVFNGHRPSGDGSIEAALREAGAPGYSGNRKPARKS